METVKLFQKNHSIFYIEKKIHRTVFISSTWSIEVLKYQSGAVNSISTIVQKVLNKLCNSIHLYFENASKSEND